MSHMIHTITRLVSLNFESSHSIRTLFSSSHLFQLFLFQRDFLFLCHQTRVMFQGSSPAVLVKMIRMIRVWEQSFVVCSRAAISSSTTLVSTCLTVPDSVRELTYAARSKTQRRRYGPLLHPIPPCRRPQAPPSPYDSHSRRA